MKKFLLRQFKLLCVRWFAFAKLRACFSAAILLVAPTLSGCAEYGIEDAVLDQENFNQAYKESNSEAMRSAADHFQKNFNADYILGRGNLYGCTANALNSLEHDVPRVQMIAIDWTGDKSAASALDAWGKLDERDEVLANRTKECATDDLQELVQLNELIGLVRTDLRERHDIDALLSAEQVRQDELRAERRANCDLELSRQKLVFQQFVRLEDVYGLDGRKRVIEEVAEFFRISQTCVERTVRNATIDHPEWLPEPL